MKRSLAISSRIAYWTLPLLLLAVLVPAARSRASTEIAPTVKGDTPSAARSAPSAPAKVMMHASWAEYYTSIADLRAHADIAVVGTVSSIGPADLLTPTGPVYSPVTLDVERVPWSAPGAATPAQVTFVQTGGEYNAVTYELEDEPLYQVGDRVLLFFTEVGPGKYRVTGGPTGRFALSGGVVRPTVKDGVPTPGGTAESTFLERIAGP